MSTEPFNRAMASLDRFESRQALSGAEAEAFVGDVLRGCGLDVSPGGFVTNPEGADCSFEVEIEGRVQIFAVEVKTGRRPSGVETVDQALRMRAGGLLNRVMVISRSGFTADALSRADGLGAGKVDLLSPEDLRGWLLKHAGADGGDGVGQTSANIIREAIRQVAQRLAQHPEELRSIEWRELEKVLREVFEGLGFRTSLTRPGRDGGFDLELVIDAPAGAEHHLVEVKHWLVDRPGARHLTKLVKVTAERKASGGLLLSTSGFTRTIYSGLLEYDSPVRLAGGAKVISLCRAFHRFGSGIWLPAEDLHETLYGGTTAPERQGRPPPGRSRRPAV